MKPTSAFALFLFLAGPCAPPVLADAVAANFQSLGGAWMHSPASYASNPITFTGGKATIQVNWSGANGKAFSFTGSFTVGVSPATLSGSFSSPYFNFSGGKVHVDAQLTGTFTTTGFFEPLRYGLVVRDSPFQSLDSSFDYTATCRVPAPPDTTLWTEQDLTSSPGSINVPLSCDLPGLRTTGTTNQFGGHAAFRMIFGNAGDPEAMQFGGYVNFTYSLQTGTIDLSVDRIEVVQAVQTPARDVPLVAGKDTVVRVFVNTGGKDVAGVDGTLTWYPVGGVPSKPRTSYNGPITAPGTWSRYVENDSLNFLLPPDWVATGGMLEVQAQIIPPAGMVDSIPANNIGSYTALVTTQASDFSIGYLTVCYQPPGVADKDRTCPTGSFATADHMIRALYPLDPRRFHYDPIPIPPRLWRHRLQTDPDAQNPYADDDVFENAFRKFLRLSGYTLVFDQVIAWLPQIPGWNTLGSSDPIWLKKTATGSFFFGQYRPGVNARDSEATVAHEIGHNLGLHHPNVVGGHPRSDACGAGDSTSTWPYQDSTVQEPGFDTAQRPAVFRPFSSFDLMTWCNGNVEWISPFDYQRLLNGNLQPAQWGSDRPALPALAPAPKAQPSAAATPVASMLVSGTVSQDNSSASLKPIYKVTGTPLVSSTGAYCMRVSQTGTPPADTCFDLPFEHSENLTPLTQEGFTLLVPWVDRASRIALLYQGSELTSITPSPHPPSVTITSPQAGQSWDASTHTIAWTANDPDGDGLTFSVLYSSDNGITWLSVAEDITDLSLDLDPSQIQGGSQVKFRVLATDGYNNASADAGPITVVQRPALAITPTPVNAHGAMVGQSRLTPVVIANSGSGPLQVTNVTSDNTAFQVVSPPFPFLIAAGGQAEIVLRFTPPATGTVTGNLNFTSNDSSHPSRSVSVQGTGMTTAVPDSEVTPTSLDFRSVAVGNTASSGVILRNYGPGTLTVTSLTVSDPQFSLSGVSTPFDLKPDDLAIPLAFTPTKAGPSNATLTIAGNDPNQPTQRVALTGVGAAAAGPVPAIASGGVVDGAQFKGPVTPGGIGSLFGSQLADGLVIASTSLLPTTLGSTSVHVNGNAAPLFFVSPSQINFQMPFEIPVGSAADVVVVRNGVTSAAQHIAVPGYAPAVFMNSVTGVPLVTRYPNNDLVTAANPAQPNDVLTIYLTGIGDLTAQPASGAPMPSSQLYAARTDPVVQVGSVTVKELFAGLTPGFIGLAQVNIQLPPDLPQGPSLPLVINFGSAASQAVQLPVRGSAPTAPAISVSPASLDFGTLNVGQNKNLAVIISNTGTAALNVTAAIVTGPAFTWTGPAIPFTLQAGAQAVGAVWFAPSAAGAQSGTLTIYSTDPAHPTISAALAGSGGGGTSAPKLAVDQTSLAFGSVTVGQYKDSALTIGDTGTAALNVTGVTVSNSAFSWVSPAPPFSVAAGAQAAATVRFTAPSTAGAQSGTLTIASNDPTRPSVQVSLTATAAAAGGSNVNIVGITLEAGVYSGGAFSPNGARWLTITGDGWWVLGISQSGNPNNPLLNAADKSVNIPPGTYYTYNLPPATFDTAVRVTIRWSDSGAHTDTAIFAVGPLATAATWTWLSGSTNVTWASTGLTNVTKVTQTLTPGTSPDNVFQLGVQASAATGSGPQISVTPASLSFGNVTVGQSASLPLTVANTGNGSGTLNVTNISAAAPFSMVLPNAPIALAAGTSTTVTVKFTPTAAGAQTGSLAVASNDPAHPSVTVPLSGTGMSGGISTPGGLPSRPAGSTLDTSNPLATNLAGLFLMNEGSGTTDRNLVDGQTAAFAGTTLPTWNTADPSIVFNGVLNGPSLSTYLNAGTGPTFDKLPVGKMTIATKVFVTTLSTGGICEKNDGNSIDSGFLFGWYFDGTLRFTIERTSQNMRVYTVPGSVPTGRWIQVAVTWDGNVGGAASAHLFVDGVELAKTTSVDGSGTTGYANATNQPFRIGNASFDVPGSFNGKMAYLAVYKGRILSPAEMNQLDAHLPIR